MSGTYDEHIAGMLAVTLQMGAGPSMVYAADALQACDAFAAAPPAVKA
jgi:hypothetical protein